MEVLIIMGDPAQHLSTTSLQKLMLFSRVQQICYNKLTFLSC